MGLQLCLVVVVLVAIFQQTGCTAMQAQPLLAAALEGGLEKEPQLAGWLRQAHRQEPAGAEGGRRHLARARKQAPSLLQAGDPNRPTFCASLPDLPLAGGGLTGPNLVQNAKVTSGTASWFCFNNCGVTMMPGVGGVNYLSTHSRVYESSGVAQDLPNLAPGLYEYVAWVRLSAGNPQTASTTLKVGGASYSCVSAVVAKSTCWTKFQGGFSISNTTDAVLYVEGPPPSVDVLVASMSVTLVNPALWRKAQNQRIYQLRTRMVQVRLQRQVNSKPVQASVRIDQVQSAFPFGGGINGAITVDVNFQNWFAAHFNWAVFQNEMKWYYNQYVPGWYNYYDADKMMAFCQAHNISVRAHNVFWEDRTYVPGWVQNLNDSELYDAMVTRVQSVVGHYKGQVKHWDVDNEPLHTHYYPNRLGPNIQPWMYNLTRAVDPNVKLFLNDYNVVEQCGDPSALPEVYLDYLSNLLGQGVDIEGLGVEAHFRDQPNPLRIKHDLDMLQLGGLPVWLTELDVGGLDYDLQADQLEIIMREAFSHPAVGGIILWQTAHPPCTEWNYFDPNVCTVCTNCLVDWNWNERPIGQRYLQLRSEWSSHVANKLTARNGILANFRGYFGSYKAVITYGGKQFTRFFDVPEGQALIKVTLKIPV